MRVLHHPAVMTEPVIALDAPASNARLNAPTPEIGTPACKFIGLVCVQPVRPAVRPASLEDHRVMAVCVGSSHPEDQWLALSVCDDMALAAEFALVRRVGARVRTPGGWPGWPRSCRLD